MCIASRYVHKNKEWARSTRIYICLRLYVNDMKIDFLATLEENYEKYLETDTVNT